MPQLNEYITESSKTYADMLAAEFKTLAVIENELEKLNIKWTDVINESVIQVDTIIETSLQNFIMKTLLKFKQQMKLSHMRTDQLTVNLSELSQFVHASDHSGPINYISQVLMLHRTLVRRAKEIEQVVGNIDNAELKAGIEQQVLSYVKTFKHATVRAIITQLTYALDTIEDTGHTALHKIKDMLELMDEINAGINKLRNASDEEKEKLTRLHYQATIVHKVEMFDKILVHLWDDIKILSDRVKLSKRNTLNIDREYHTALRKLSKVKTMLMRYEKEDGADVDETETQ